MRPDTAGAVPRLAALATVLALWIAGSPVPANALVGRLEVVRSGPSDCPDDVDLPRAESDARLAQAASPLPMVIPGGGMDAWRQSDSAYELLHRDSLQRVERAADLAAPATRFLLLGGGDNGRTVADLMRQVLLDRGIDDEHVLVESRSRSTRENARELTRLLPPADHPRIRLVTSQLHLARASAVFERAGYVVCGTGVGSIAAPAAGVAGWLPWLSAFSRTTHAWRESLATLADRRPG